MSGHCGNCNCADNTQCVNKGNQIGMIETETIYYDGMMEGGNCGGCKCGAGCACTDCTCCTH
ncbi:hypothetical protein SOVF_132380 [Spinacia oleracea]|nr:hypothetical protein SOVF_132380 [Spinacia oleracea]